MWVKRDTERSAKPCSDFVLGSLVSASAGPGLYPEGPPAFGPLTSKHGASAPTGGPPFDIPDGPFLPGLWQWPASS